MKTKEQVIEWLTGRVAVDKKAADAIITILEAWDIYDVYVRYFSECDTGDVITKGDTGYVITRKEFYKWFYGGWAARGFMDPIGRRLDVGKNPEQMAEEAYPDVPDIENIMSEDTYKTNEIRLLQRIAFITGWEAARGTAIKT